MYKIYQYDNQGNGHLQSTFTGSLTDLITLVNGLKTSTGINYYAEAAIPGGCTKVYDTSTS